MSEWRKHLSADDLADYDRLRGSFGVASFPQARLYKMSGADHMDWLQGQATNDMRLLATRPFVDFCLCAPTGQLEGIFRAHAAHDATWIAADDAASAEALERRVERLVILEDVTLETYDWSLASVQGPQASEQAGRLSVEGLVLTSDRFGQGGFDVWTAEDLPWPPAAPAVVEVVRIESGIPKRGFDFTERTLPPELGPAFDRAHVSYAKGCYTGQEVLHRIFSRGHTNRTWVGLRAETVLEPGMTVAHDSRPDAGVVTSAVLSPTFGPIATAMLRNDAAQEGGEVTVAGTAARVVLLPFWRESVL